MKSKYETYNQWAKLHRQAAKIAKEKGLTTLICEKFGWKIPKEIKPAGFWDIKENCYASFKKQPSIVGWIKNCAASYNAAKRNGWYDDWVHEIRKKDVSTHIKWDEEKIIKDLMTFDSKPKWIKNRKSYSAALRLGILEKLLLMRGWNEEPFNPTKEECDRISLKYRNNTEFRKSSDRKYYYYAERKNWLIKRDTKKPRGYWTEEKIFKKVALFSANNQWYSMGEGSYEVAKKLGIVDKCKEIIKNNNNNLG